MRQNKLWYIPFVILLIVFMILPSIGQEKTTFPKSGYARLTLLIGDVQIGTPDPANPTNILKQPAQSNMEITLNSTVYTGVESSVELLLSDKSVIKIGSNSQLIIKQLTQNNNKKTVLELALGQIRAVVAKISGQNFSITTPNGVASVRGTDFSIALNTGNKDENFLVFTGKVEISSKLSSIRPVIVNAGKMVSLIAGGLLSNIIDIPPQVLEQYNKDMDIKSETTEDKTVTDGDEQKKDEEQIKTDEQKEFAETKTKSDFEKWLEEYLNFFGTFGSIVINDKVYSQFTVDTEINLGNIGFALYFPIIYDNADGGLFVSTSWYNRESYLYSFNTVEEGFTSVGKILSLFRYFRINTPVDDFYLKIGQFDDFILGNGMNMYNYSNMYNFPVTRVVGLNTTMLFGSFGFNLAVNNIAKPEVIGFRPFIEFIKGVPFYIGFEVVADIAKAYYNSNDPIFGSMGFGFTFPIVRSIGLLSIIGYADISANFVVNPSGGISGITNGFGVFGGLRGNVLFIKYKAEYRMLTGEYIPQLFNESYQLNRDSVYLPYFISGVSLFDFSNFGNLIENATHGLFLSAEFALFNEKLTGNLGWIHYFNVPSNMTDKISDTLMVGITLNKGLIDDVNASVNLIKPQFLNSNIDFFENLWINANIGYQIDTGFRVIVSYDIFYIFVDPLYEMKQSYSIATEVSFF